MSAEVMKIEAGVEVCAVCGGGEGDLRPPEEHDAALPPGAPPLRSILLHLSHNKAIPSGPVCTNCVVRATDAYELSISLSTQATQPLSEKIRALRKRLHDLTQKIDVFIVVGSQTQDGGTGTYSEEDIIMVERSALAAAAADDELLERASNARGDHVYQCSICPESFQRVAEYRAHWSSHGAGAGAGDTHTDTHAHTLHSCWTCGQQYATRDLLLAHQREEHAPHAPADRTCYLCNTYFQSQSSLRVHTCPSVCPVCGETFPSRAELSSHVRLVHSSCDATATGHVACAACYRVFSDAAQLTAHRLSHRHARQYVCGYDNCILRFATRNTLLSHIRKCHSGGGEAEVGAGEGAGAAGGAGGAAGGEVPCQHCYRTFGSVAAMKRHNKVHRNELLRQEAEAEAEAMLEGGEVEYLEVETLEEGGEGAEGGEQYDDIKDGITLVV